MRRRRLAAWGALLVLSLALHLWRLPERSFHHDEAIHAKLSWDLARHGAYRYDPTYHGPLLYHLVAATYLVAGDSDLTARLPAALAGVALLAVAWALRRPFGERAAWWTGLAATLSPMTLYYSRFLRMDAPELLFASAALVAGWRALRGSRRAWPWLGVWSGLALATKENAYVTAALVAGVAAAMGLAAGPRRSLRRALAVLGERRWGVVAAASAAVLVAVPLYTFWFTQPEGVLFPFTAIRYWWAQHEMQRIPGPWWFHLFRLGVYEWLIVGAAAAWLLRRGRRLWPVERFLGLLGLGSLAMYCYLGEKVPWLGVHQLMPLYPLAGAQLARTFGRRGRWWSRAVAALALAATAAVSVRASFVLEEISPARRRVEALHFVQTCPEALAVAREGVALAASGEAPVAAVSGEAVWPLTWYWRHLDVLWSEPPRGVRPPLVICDPEREAGVRAVLGPGYRRERIPLRAWWLPEAVRPTARQLLRYLVTREPWGGIGSTDVIVLRRSEAGPSVREAAAPEALAAALGVRRAAVLAEGRLAEPRAVAAGPAGVAVTDPVLGQVLLLDPETGAVTPLAPGAWNAPEGAAWTADGRLLVADTWNHRVVAADPASGEVEELPPPPGGWYGPRAVAVAADGTAAVADTGNRRVVLYPPGGGPVRPLGEDAGLVEPVGLAWDGDGLAVCDTGNHRVVWLDAASGAVTGETPLPGGWPDFYSRPQIARLAGGSLLATDPPARRLWLVARRGARAVDLAGTAIVPGGVAVGTGGVVYLGDLEGRVWRLEVGDG